MQLWKFAAALFLICIHSSAWGQQPGPPLCDPGPADTRNGRTVTRGYRVFPDQLLPRCNNNVWYSYTNSPTVFVFIHGLGSDSSGSWLNETTREFWPELVRSDDLYERPSIFLAGYPTAITGNDPYSIRDAAKSLFDTLNTPTPGRPSILASKKNIVFVAHSMGGVVVRHMLSRAWHIDAFKDRVIGLALVASPSLGSKLATFGDKILPFIPLFGLSDGAKQLQWQSEFLVGLHEDFQSVLTRSVYPHLKGIEFYEAGFIMTGGREVVVEKSSAARYFDSYLISGSNHWSIAKPSAQSSTPSANTTLITFYQTHLKPEIDALASVPKSRKIVLMDSYAHIYDRAHARPGEMNSHIIRQDLASLDASFAIEPVHDNWNSYQNVIEHKPDLVVIHYSSLGSSTSDLPNFLNYLLSRLPAAQVLVYSRSKWTNFEDHVRSLVDRRYSHRVFGYHVARSGVAPISFADSRVAGELRSKVQARLIALP
jgi:pimeloyl-ACP methyl ester carboxylesterase